MKDHLEVSVDYQKLYYRNSKIAFLKEATKQCESSEDASVCIEKHKKVFDIVFESLKKELDRENKVYEQLNRRLFYEESINSYRHILTNSDPRMFKA